MPDKPRLSRRRPGRRQRGAKLTKGSCRRLPRGSSWCGCSGRGTRCAPPEGACETSAPSAPSTASRRWRRRGRARECRRCSSRWLAFRVHGGWGGNAAVVCVTIALLPLARFLPAAPRRADCCSATTGPPFSSSLSRGPARCHNRLPSIGLRQHNWYSSVMRKVFRTMGVMSY